MVVIIFILKEVYYMKYKYYIDLKLELEIVVKLNKYLYQKNKNSPDSALRCCVIISLMTMQLKPKAFASSIIYQYQLMQLTDIH